MPATQDTDTVDFAAALSDLTLIVRQYPTLLDMVLVEKYREPQRLWCLAAVALGFELLVWEGVG